MVRTVILPVMVLSMDQRLKIGKQWPNGAKQTIWYSYHLSVLVIEIQGYDRGINIIQNHEVKTVNIMTTCGQKPWN